MQFWNGFPSWREIAIQANLALFEKKLLNLHSLFKVIPQHSKEELLECSELLFCCITQVYVEKV